MSHDPEAAWPLTPEIGYSPAPYSSPLDALTANVGPLSPATRPVTSPAPYLGASLPVVPAKAESPGVLIAKLAIILGTAIPLTAIATSMVGLIGLIIVWVGIIMVAGIALGPGSGNTYRRRG